MDRTLIENALKKELAEAENWAAQGRAHVTHQREVIDTLERDGHDATQAKELLKTLQETQDLHEASVERLMKELEVWNKRDGKAGE
jgi:arginine repressor